MEHKELAKSAVEVKLLCTLVSLLRKFNTRHRRILAPTVETRDKGLLFPPRPNPHRQFGLLAPSEPLAR
jgi:hypothetical protein